MANIILPPVIPAFNGVLCISEVGDCTDGVLPAPTWTRIGGMDTCELECPVNMTDAPMYGTGGWMSRVPGFASWNGTVSGLYLDNNDEGQDLILDIFFGDNQADQDTIPEVSCGQPTEVGCLPASEQCTQRNPMWFRFIPDGCSSPLTGEVHLQYIGIAYISNWGIASQVEDNLMLNLELTGTGALVPGTVTVTNPEG